MASVSDLFHVGIGILKTTVDSIKNTILVQAGSATDQYVATDNADWYQHVGFASRPSVAIAGTNAAECVGIRTGDRDVIFASRDIRSMAAYGNLSDGETCVYAAGPDGNSQACVMLKKDGSITLKTTHNNQPTGTTVALQLSPTGLGFSAPWGSFVFNATGFHLRTAAGPRLDMGGINIPGIPSSISAPLTAYATITAPTVTLKGALVNLGVGPTYGLALQAPSALFSSALPITPVMAGPANQSPSVRVSLV